jgi:dTDP-glucose pyrophosphorylase
METVDLRSLANVGDARLTILCVDEITDGPAGTLEVAKPALNMHEPLVVANSDQYIDASMEDFYADLVNSRYDGEILAMRDNDPKWSFARANDEGLLLEVKEKVVISNLATVGIYGFGTARLAFEAIQRMREAGDRTNGEYYVGPCYNYIVGQGRRIFVRDLGKVSNVMHGLGIPEDLDLFLASSVSKKAVGV